MDPLSFLAWRFYYFFRDPVRHPPTGDVVLAPADGVVVYVKEVQADSLPSPVKQGVKLPLEEWTGAVAFEGATLLIGIYMTPLSVHFNRAPVAGTVTRVLPRPARGENRSMARMMMRWLWRMQPFDQDCAHITGNARCTTVIDGPVRTAVIQIADRYVNTIDCFVAEGDELRAGDKIGMIRMGSQCDLLVAAGDRPLTITCRAGDRVCAGESILAELG